MLAGRGGVHGNGDEGVAVAELVVGEAGFFGAEEEGDAAAGGEGLVDVRGGDGQGPEGVLEDALADGGGAEDEGAVGDGGG